MKVTFTSLYQSDSGEFTCIDCFDALFEDLTLPEDKGLNPHRGSPARTVAFNHPVPALADWSPVWSWEQSEDDHCGICGVDL